MTNLSTDALPTTCKISAEEIERQWKLLAKPSKRIQLSRPAAKQDGVEQLAISDHNSLMDTHRQSADQGRWMKFVPASGAASRMFAMRAIEDQLKFGDAFREFAFADEARTRLIEQGVDVDKLLQDDRYEELIDYVVGVDGLNYGKLPKGLLKFHAYHDGNRSAFEEHLSEASECLSNSDGEVTAHFTVGAMHRQQFEEALSNSNYREANVTFSEQHPSTDTVAIDTDGQLLKDAHGELILRPGGHGALLDNLNGVAGDLIFIKNIDNVAHQTTRDTALQWMRILGGYLARLEVAVHQHLHAIKANDAGAISAAFDFVQITFPGATMPPAEDSESLRAAVVWQLQRPLRVCGMVKNDGEPGGGPFWVRGDDGSCSLQIVESAEVNEADFAQQVVFREATHFNPVMMALAVRDESGEPYDLREFVNEDRAIVTHKDVDGQPATVLERPGLWNGAMAQWNSVFVEVPSEVFAPVKTVLDLLRDAHRGR